MEPKYLAEGGDYTPQPLIIWQWQGEPGSLGYDQSKINRCHTSLMVQKSGDHQWRLVITMRLFTSLVFYSGLLKHQQQQDSSILATFRETGREIWSVKQWALGSWGAYHHYNPLLVLLLLLVTSTTINTIAATTLLIEEERERERVWGEVRNKESK